MKQYFLEQLKELGEKIAEYPYEDVKFYSAWLAQTHAYVFHSTRILTFAAAYYPAGQEEFRRRFCAHSNEEKGHDRLPIADLKHLKLSLADLPILPSTKSFYEIQYAKIQHLGPSTLFGWIVMLEGAAVMTGGHIFERTKKAHGEKASLFLKVHSDEDPDHLDKAFGFLGKVTPEEMTLIKENFHQSAYLYLQMLDGCLAYAKSKKAAA